LIICHLQKVTKVKSIGRVIKNSTSYLFKFNSNRMAISIKDTKNAIFNAYKEAVAEMKLLEKQFIGKETEATKLAQELSACQDVNGEPEVIYRVPEINTLKGIIETLKSVEMGISNSFGESSSLQVVEAEKLEDLRKQIESEHKGMVLLHN
jgi:hypothetical protein